MSFNSVIKKLLFTLALMMMSMFNASAAMADCPFIRGDVTGDGMVEPSDIPFLINHVENGFILPYDCEDVADVDDDGDVDMDDVDRLTACVYLMQSVAHQYGGF